MHYINRILQSASDAAQFQSIFAASENKIRSRSNAASWGTPRTTTDFDITAGAFEVPVAMDPSIAAMALDARKAGYSASQILKARAELNNTRRQPDELERVIQDPLKLRISTPIEKVELIQDLLKGQISTRAARAVVTILLSSKNAEEYEAVCAQAGGADIGKKLKDPDARKKWDLLAGAMGRMDFAIDTAIAATTQKCLLDRAAIQKQMRDWDPVKSSAASAFSHDPLKKLVQEQVARSMERLNSAIPACDSRTLAEGLLINSERRKQGKPEWNPLALRWEAHLVLREQKTDKEKKMRLEELNKTESPFTVRNVIYPIVFLYSLELREMEKFGESVVGKLDDTLSREGLRSGPESPNLDRIQMSLDRVSSVLDPFTYLLSRAVSILETQYSASTRMV